MLRSTYPFFSSSIALAESRSPSLATSSDRSTYLQYASSPPSGRLGSHRLCFSPGAVVVLSFVTFNLLPSFGFAAGQLEMMKSQLQIAEKPVEQNTLGRIKKPGSEVGDPSALDHSSQPAPIVRDPRVLNAAKMYEKYFLGQMMKAMRSTVNRSELEKQSMGETVYREQLDDQYVDSWGERGGIGLADMIHDELVGKAEMMKMRRAAMKAAKGKARTPMALTDRDVMKVRKLPGVQSADGQATVETVLVSLGKTTSRPEDGPESVRSPWAGTITKLESQEGKVVIGLETGGVTAGVGGATATEAAPADVAATAGADVATLSEENRMNMAAPATIREASRKVELAFDGVTFQVTVGDVVKAGQTIGQLGKGARGILLRQTLVQGANLRPPSVGM